MPGRYKVISTYPFSPELQSMLREAAQSDVVCIGSDEDLQELLPEAEILCAPNLPQDWRELSPHLHWLQAPSAGVDGFRSSGVLDKDSGIMVTTASGIHASTISEYVMASMLMFNRSWPEMVRLQDRHIWPHSTSWYKLGGRELVDQTLGIVGLGHIGRRIAQLGRAFGMTVLASSRSIQPGQQDPDIDQLYPMSRLNELLRQSDYVVLAVPLTPQSVNLIGEAELRAMRPNAYLVNVARGQVVDEHALIRALREGWIAGAGLDVAEREPLAAESPLFSLPNVILTPHISGVSIHYGKRLADLFADNLRRYRAGEPLLNLFDPSRGY